MRNSERMVNCFALCIRYGEEVLRYRIWTLNDSGCCYIDSESTFSGLNELITYHTWYAGCLKCALVTPCPGQSPIHRLEIERNNVKLIEEIGKGQFGVVWRGVLEKRISVAVKSLKSGKMSRNAFLDEAGIMTRLCHKNLVQVCMRSYLFCTVP